MPVIYAPESKIVTEMNRWNTPRSMGGMRPDRFEEYPQMLYMARKRRDGIRDVSDPRDDAWTQGCQLTVNSDRERADAIERGWRPTPAEALARYDAKEDARANVAAHRAYEDRNMSEAARAEVAAAEAETSDQLPEIPERRRRGRPRKEAAAA